MGPTLQGMPLWFYMMLVFCEPLKGHVGPSQKPCLRETGGTPPEMGRGGTFQLHPPSSAGGLRRKLALPGKMSPQREAPDPWKDWTGSQAGRTQAVRTPQMDVEKGEDAAPQK